MKKIISLVALVLLFISCDMGDGDGPKYTLELLPVESVDIPSEFTLGETCNITLHYKRPSTCHYYNSLYYEKGTGDLSNVRTVAIESAVLESNNCQPLTNEMTECTFSFMPTTSGSYIFKFWHGKDASGNNIFLEYEVPVN